MCAYSLRTWRRNGVACDELLFLPGTLHGHEHGVEGPLIEMPETQPHSPTEQSQTSRTLHRAAVSPDRSSCSQGGGGGKSEADRAAGVGAPRVINSTGSFRQRRSASDEEGGISSVGSSHGDVEQDSGPHESIAQGTGTDGQTAVWENADENDENIVQTQGLLQRGGLEMGSNHEGIEGGDERNSGPVQRWRENHPGLSRLGTFFFFRSGTTTTQNAAYAPSGPAVFGAALDLSMPVLFNFHLFIEAYNHMQGPDGSDAPAKILPLIFLSVLMVRTIIPPSRRFRFWGTMKFAMTAPLYHVRFRDEFIGDAITSWVRPGQDLFFALSYYVTVIYGTISGKYGLEQSSLKLEESLVLHNVIMPSFAILPLWLKYLQTLRQAHDSNKRWPHQANSFKYLSATLVIIYAITHPDKRSSPWFMASFGLAVIYQLCWDIFVDWELFEIQRNIEPIDAEYDSCWARRISSFQPTSHTLLAIQMYLVQPVMNVCQRIRASIPSWRQIQLRQKRLYKTQAFYWKILAYNILCRFTWMLCFIPAYHVSRSRTVLTNTNDVNSYWGVLLPVAEIIRRTLWGFLFVERETIKLMDADVKYSRVSENDREEDEDDNEDADSKFGDRSFRTQLLPTWLDNQQQVAHNAATTRAKQRDSFMRQLFVIELYGWAAAFVVLGCWATN